jgi:phenylacetic acid degradation operon negative regulatory protein
MPERDDLGLRPLTARSVLASTLLGLDPPVLPVRRLVATAGLLGISEGSARTALSRMAAAGEVEAVDGRYRLTGRLLDRHHRQEAGRHPRPRRWRGDWLLAVVVAERRTAVERAELRAALAGGRLAEWREGVWTRPDNLERPALPAAVAGHVEWATARPEAPPRLWDLDAWAGRGRLLLARLETAPLGDPADLAPGFVLSAAVVRHLAADPLLPPQLLPPGWPGDDLRRTYDRWDAAWRALLADWHRAQPPA